MSTVLLALDMAASDHPGRWVGAMIARLLVLGGLIWLVVWAVRRSRAQKRPQYPYPPGYQQPMTGMPYPPPAGHWPPPAPPGNWPPQQQAPPGWGQQPGWGPPPPGWGQQPPYPPPGPPPGNP